MQTFTQTEQDEILKVKTKISSRLHDAVLGLPMGVFDLVKTGVVTGGISASYFHNEKENDIDVYLTNQSHIAALKALIESDSDVILETIQDVNNKYNQLEVLINGKLVTAHAVTFKCGVQIITMETIDARNKFDFEHCKPYYDIAAGKYYISRRQYDSIKNKKLECSVGVTPDSTRLSKFVDRGWKL